MSTRKKIIEDGDEAILFDPSYGKQIAAVMEAHIRQRREAGADGNRAFVIAGHSHLDHANNSVLSNVLGAPETHLYVHEGGIVD